jgi:hypothetical protein
MSKYCSKNYRTLFDYSLSKPWHPVTANEWSSKKVAKQPLSKYPFTMEWEPMHVTKRTNDSYQLESNLKRKKFDNGFTSLSSSATVLSMNWKWC